jgi:hypothetical protein
MNVEYVKQISLMQSEMKKVEEHWKSQKYKGSGGIVMDNYMTIN